ncbi:MAG TPA: adenylyl-sulfate kinase, partial [Methanomicrobia archaeon]|nr:adenylyl-sulfate kinase [Methanomicrobia archaeon]HEX59908.1 adenylyl-sulfate kinase [Methanomicrobia archaeon]
MCRGRGAERGFTLWFTGLPCSGKTTLADAVAERLRQRGLKVERLDGDIVRRTLSR